MILQLMSLFFPIFALFVRHFTCSAGELMPVRRVHKGMASVVVGQFGGEIS
jgi:hypothetical protein